MGRTTPATRMSFEDLLSRMRKEYKDALLSRGRRDAFDRLVEAWSAELGAISYAESFTLMDLLLLTGVIEDRRVAEELSLRISELERRADKLSLLDSEKKGSVSAEATSLRGV